MLTRPTTVHLVSGHGTGSWQGGPLYVTLATSITADVTRDGRPDQVLLLGCASVGSAYASEVQVFADATPAHRQDPSSSRTGRAAA